MLCFSVDCLLAGMGWNANRQLYQLVHVPIAIYIYSNWQYIYIAIGTVAFKIPDTVRDGRVLNLQYSLKFQILSGTEGF